MLPYNCMYMYVYFCKNKYVCMYVKPQIVHIQNTRIRYPRTESHKYTLTSTHTRKLVFNLPFCGPA